MTSERTTQWGEHSGPVLDQAKGFEVIDCGRCGFRHVVPLPTDAELKQAYQEEYYTEEKPQYLERARADAEWWDLAYDDRFDTFESVLSPERRRILDVGSGPGLFLLRGQRRGWQVQGVEPSAQAAAHARESGLDIVEAFFDDETASGLPEFDVVHMSEVLEHIPQPRAMLERAAKKLSSGGLLCVLVPNDYNALQEAVTAESGADPWWVAPPHHLNYFDCESLQALIASAGFEIVLVEGTFPLEIFLLMGLDYTTDDALGRECHSRRMQMELALSRSGRNQLRRETYRALIGQGIGRQIMVVARQATEI